MDKPLDSFGFKTLVNFYPLEEQLKPQSKPQRQTSCWLQSRTQCPLFYLSRLPADQMEGFLSTAPKRNIFISGQSEGGLFCRVHWWTSYFPHLNFART